MARPGHRGAHSCTEFFLANSLLVLSFVAMRRGTRVFGRLAPTDREQGAVVVLTMAGPAGAVACGAGMLPLLVGHAILSVDIDRFKLINDRWGHAAGDAVLVRVAQALRDASREVDSVARMGGEEFCLLLPGVDPAGAERAAQRLLEVVRGLRHPEVDRSLKVTVSIGVVVVGPTAEPLPALLRRLDDALYAAKDQGRDRYQRAPPAEAC